MRRIPLIVAAVLLASLPGSAGAAIRLHDLGLIPDPVLTTYGGPARVFSDGLRYIANATSAGSVSVLDVETGRRRTIPQLGRCRFVDIHHGAVLWACPAQPPVTDAAEEYGAVQSLAGGAIEFLPSVQPRFLMDVMQVSWGNLGDRYATIDLAGYHSEATVAVDRRTGVERLIADPGRDAVVDLDRPGLTRRLCRGQRRGLQYGDTSVLMPALLSTAGAWAATETAAGDSAQRLELQHCGAKPLTIATTTYAMISEPVITERFMAWTEQPLQGSGMRLFVRFNRSGRILRSSLTKQGTSLSMLLAGPRVYVVENTANPADQRLLRVELPASAV